ncbi:MAG: hypothetical protein FJ006_05225 [Chloroflexi bacterium]|nr:hypothetical protein [Chloroflexota bacterium]
MIKAKGARLAYLAGFFDGEGCVTVVKGKNHLGNIQYSLRVIVSNTNEYVLKMYQFSFGGRIQKHKHNKPKWRDCYFWQLSSTQAYTFLKCVYPYLTLKKSQADLAFEFQENQSKYDGSNLKLNDRELSIREAQRILMQDLKRL